LWVLHQDHYLSGEWAKTVSGIVHNDLCVYVARQNQIEANGPAWGLQDVQLPMFPLSQRIAKDRLVFSNLSTPLNGDLPMSQEVDWHTESLYRLSHYQPEVLTLYLRETLRVASPDSLLVYVGENITTFELIRRMWEECSPSSSPVRNLSEDADNGEILSPDILLVDAYYERSEYAQRRVRLIAEQMERRLSRGKISEQQVWEEVGTFANGVDYEAWQSKLMSLWEKRLSRIRLSPGRLVIVMGCNMYCGLYLKLKEEIARRCEGVKIHPLSTGRRRRATVYPGTEGREKSLRKAFRRIHRVFAKSKPLEAIQGVTLAQHSFRHENQLDGPVDLLPLYIHHRLMVLRVS